MSELKEKIAQYLASDRLAVVTGKFPAEGWATRCADGILALLNQQPITAETVRRVLDAMGGLIGSDAKPDDWLNHEAIAHRANQQEEK